MKVFIKAPVKKAAEPGKKSDSPTNSVEAAASELAIFVQLSKDHIKRRKAHHKQVRTDVCSAYEFGRRLVEHHNLWVAFLKEDWEGIARPDEGDQTDAVRYAIKFMVGPGKDAQKKASFYFRAIKKLAEAGASVKEVKKALKKHGFRALAKKNVKVEDKDASASASKNGDLINTTHSMATWNGQDSKQNEAGASTKKAAAASASAGQAKSNRPSNAQNKIHSPATLSMDWTAFECNVMLASKALKLTRMADGQNFLLSCTFIASEPPTLRVMSVQKDGDQ